MTKRGFKRPLVAALHDMFMAGLSFVLALYLRYGDAMMDATRAYLVEGTVLFTVVCGVIFWRMRFYRALWRYASLSDLIALTKGVTLAILIFIPLLFFATRLEDYPRSATVINWFLLLALLGGPRFVYRMIKDRGIGWALARASRIDPENRIPVLLIGAGDAAEMFIRDMTRGAARAPYRVVGALDDDRAIIGGQIHGVRIFAAVDDVAEVVEKLTRRGQRPQRLLLSERVPGETVRALLDTADHLGLTLARLPRLTDFQSGEIEDAAEVRPIAIEDLLGRPQTVLDRAAMAALIEGRRVMVTGAGGTIGGELTRQVASYGPAHLVLFDHAEFSLYEIDGEITERHPELSRATILGDIRDRMRIDQVLAREKPDLIFHAAAFKHVPMVEANPNEGVLTNVVGTRNLADACNAAGIETMVMISTDKAVNPSSVMGATKRIAELYCQALGAASSASSGGTRFVTVRFGNVLGSTGSVVPLFQRQLAAGGPLTVTHPHMTRYFMTVREAVELVLQATAIEGSETPGGDIYVLEMGTPVRIDELARQMIRLAGLRPDEDIAIEYSGVREGEKMHEELFLSSETPAPTSRAGVLLATSEAVDLDELRRLLTELADAARARRTTETFALIHRIVPTYGPPLDDSAAIGAAQ